MPRPGTGSPDLLADPPAVLQLHPLDRAAARTGTQPVAAQLRRQLLGKRVGLRPRQGEEVPVGHRHDRGTITRESGVNRSRPEPPRTIKARAEQIPFDLGLRRGAGDGNRTCIISLGSGPIMAYTRRRAYQSFGYDTTDAADRPSLATYRRLGVRLSSASRPRSAIIVRCGCTDVRHRTCPPRGPWHGKGLGRRCPCRTPQQARGSPGVPDRGYDRPLRRRGGHA
jgi:hypothetical protein